MAADEIERFRLEIVERSRDARAGDNITDQELLREVMNTVGKPGQLHDALASEMPLRKGAAGSGLEIALEAFRRIWIWELENHDG